MTFISYAQNFEDVMLWRALKHIPNGTYVDVGAQDPITHSISKAFYDRGWRGVHIEPVHEHAELLRANRSDEFVLEMAIGDTDGTLELNVVPNSGLSTSIERYAKNAALLFDNCYKAQVPMLTLTSALDFLIGKEIHWLKIDVEGFEEQVLKGWDSQLLRPWIMVIEATIPCSPELAYEAWHPMMIHADYQFVYFDGLNRFYVAKEHPELIPAFSCPPNCFDGFNITSSSPFSKNSSAPDQSNEFQFLKKAEALHTKLNTSNVLINQLKNIRQELDIKRSELNDIRQILTTTHQELTNTQQALQHSQQKLSESEQKSEEAQQHVRNMQQELQTVYASKSWRITLPLRKTMKTSQYLVNRINIKWFKKVLNYFLRCSISLALKINILTKIGLPILNKYPTLKARLIRFYKSPVYIQPYMDQSDVDIAYDSLSPRAQKIYRELKKLIPFSNNMDDE